jgi:hypothetical protein
MTINGQIVYGGIPASVDEAPWPSSPAGVLVAQWKGNVMLVTPALG